MQTIYLNVRTSEGIETVDQFTQGEDSPKEYREFKKYVNDMIGNYHMTGQNVYKSQRCTNYWKA